MFQTQSGVDREFRSDSPVVLQEPCRVCVLDGVAGAAGNLTRCGNPKLQGRELLSDRRRRRVVKGTIGIVREELESGRDIEGSAIGKRAIEPELCAVMQIVAAARGGQRSGELI